MPDKAAALKDVKTFERVAGGAPANVAVCNSVLGGTSFFIGKLGRDGFGDFLSDTLMEKGVRTDYLFRTNEANTALAFVTHSPGGEREFAFYRNPSADMLLNENEIGEWFGSGDILHFCSVDLIEAPVKYAHIKAIELCKKSGGEISFDVNIRPPLWKSEQECIKTIIDFLRYADYLKVSDDELFQITKIKNEKQAVQKLLTFAAAAKFIFVTKGGDGVTVYDRTEENISYKPPKVKVADTTGAGDCFIGCALHKILQADEPVTLKTLSEIIIFASIGAAYIVTQKGAMPAMPAKSDIQSMYIKYKIKGENI